LRLLTIVGAAFLATLTACSPKETHKPANSGGLVKAANFDAKLAPGPEGTYARTCGYCHGANVGPVILGRNLPPEAIEAVVRSGRGAMPAFRPTEISEEELTALADWVSKSPPRAGEAGK